MTDHDLVPPAVRVRSQVPWWLSGGAGLALLGMLVGIGWTLSWNVVTDHAPQQAAVEATWSTTDAVTITAYGDGGTSDTYDEPEPPRQRQPSEHRHAGGTDHAEEPSRTEAIERRLDPEEVRRRQEARIRRAQRSDRELAAFIESVGVVLQLWVAPISADYRITATFGAAGSLWSADHTGVDLAAPTGTPVVAAAAGTVTSAGDAGAYGSRIAITHADGTETMYAHLSRMDVSEGQTVAAGQVIGAVGSTGNSTGPHLHLELRTSSGVPVDPVEALRAQGVDLATG